MVNDEITYFKVITILNTLFFFVFLQFHCINQGDLHGRQVSIGTPSTHTSNHIGHHQEKQVLK